MKKDHTTILNTRHLPDGQPITTGKTMDLQKLYTADEVKTLFDDFVTYVEERGNNVWWLEGLKHEFLLNQNIK